MLQDVEDSLPDKEHGSVDAQAAPGQPPNLPTQVGAFEHQSQPAEAAVQMNAAKPPVAEAAGASDTTGTRDETHDGSCSESRCESLCTKAAGGSEIVSTTACSSHIRVTLQRVNLLAAPAHDRYVRQRREHHVPCKQ